MYEDELMEETAAVEAPVFEDETITCVECGKEFIFSAGEQAFYAEKGYTNKPKRCKACRDAKKNAGKPERQYFYATCDECGGEAKLTFEPTPGKKVYCSACWDKRRKA